MKERSMRNKLMRRVHYKRNQREQRAILDYGKVWKMLVGWSEVNNFLLYYTYSFSLFTLLNRYSNIDIDITHVFIKIKKVNIHMTY